MDSFVAVTDSCEDLNNIEKFNYLHSYLEGEAFCTIQGIKLTDKKYPEALEVLRGRYGNKQRIISAHINELLNIKKIERDRYLQGLCRLYDELINITKVERNRDLQGLHRLYDDIGSHVCSLQSLDVDDGNYGSLLMPVIME